MLDILSCNIDGNKMDMFFFSLVKITDYLTYCLLESTFMLLDNVITDIHQ